MSLEEQNIKERTIEEEMRSAYIDYSMSVIVSRALPDVRDGLKPVHRRVLYGMNDLGLSSNRPHKKSARIVGEVLGKYHPHGDYAVYETMVRMAQTWSLRYPLVDGQGNFGSMDGDSPAAMRYTEARLNAIAEELMADIEKRTVDFIPNFDDSLTEPSVMPAAFPNLLVNGSSGIAVGMATNMAPHNLKEVIEGITAYIDNNSISLDELMKCVKAPDFPTGGIIYGYEGVRDAYLKGKGKIILRAVARIEQTKNGRDRIIISEIPYQVNKATLHARIHELASDKKIEGISEIRDESDRDGLRLVVDVRKEGNSNVILNNLYKFTQMQISFSINSIALVKGRPMRLGLKDLIRYYVEHRLEIVVRRTQYDLEQALLRAHILEGLIIALDNLDEVIRLIRAAKTVDIAREGLMSTFGLTEIQAKAILDMRLQRLTNLESDKIRMEYVEIMKKIEYYRSILASEEIRLGIIKTELKEISDKYGDARRTQIVYIGEDYSIEDLIVNEEVVITISHAGYIKRTLMSEYKRQGRGGTGSKGASTKEEDFLEHLFIAKTHNYILLFTLKGRCYWLKTYEIPESAKANKGRAIQNLIQIPSDDKVLAFIMVETLSEGDYLDKHSIVMCTKQGTIKRTSLEAFSNPRVSGINAITISEGDELVSAHLATDTTDVLIATKNGLINRFDVATQVREMGRTASGVRGINLTDGDEVIGMLVYNHGEDVQVLVLAQKGFGKRSSINQYSITRRGGKGVKTMNLTEKTGKLIAVTVVQDTDDLMIITQEGIAIRIAVKSIPKTSRNTQGVRLIKIRENDAIAAVAKIAEPDDDTQSNNDSVVAADGIIDEENNNGNETSALDDLMGPNLFG